MAAKTRQWSPARCLLGPDLFTWACTARAGGGLAAFSQGPGLSALTWFPLPPEAEKDSSAGVQLIKAPKLVSGDLKGLMESRCPDPLPSSVLLPTLPTPGKYIHSAAFRHAPLAWSRPGLFFGNRAVVCLHPSSQLPSAVTHSSGQDLRASLEAEASRPCSLIPATPPTHTQ